MFLTEREFHENIPTLEVVQESIENFRKLNWDILSLDAVPKIIDKSLLSYLFLRGPSPKIDNLFRVRTFNSFDVRTFNSFDGLLDLATKSSFYYPPIEFCSLNRCNVPNKQVFYGSVNINTALTETLNKNESLCFVSKWKVENFEKVDGVYFFGNKNDQKLKNQKLELMKNLTIEDSKVEVLDTIHNFIEEVFSTPFTNPNCYKFTAYLSNNLFYNMGIEIGFLAYTSVKKANGAINYALRKDIADKHLKLDKVYMCQVIEHNFETGKYNYSFPKYGSYSEDYKKLKWQDMNQTEYDTLMKLLNPHTKKMSQTE